jgi:hypothetical protein
MTIFDSTYYVVEWKKKVFVREIPPLMRALIKYEIVWKFSFEEQNYAFMANMTDTNMR